MAHNISKEDKVGMALTGAWHGLGEVVPEDMDPKDAIAEYLGWGVDKAPLYAKVPVGTGKARKEVYIEVPDFQATYRTDYNKILGVVGSKYQPIQHTAMLEDIDALCGESGAKVHTIGSLRGGSKVWILLKLTEQAKIAGDKFNQFLAIMSSHDGSMKYTVAPTAVRIVCDNTFRAAIGNASQCIRVKHTKKAADAIVQARNVLGSMKVSFAEYADTLEKLAKVNVNGAFADFVFQALAPGETTQSSNVRNLLKQAYNRPRGGLTPAITNTALGIYNAVTEYVDYMSRTRRTQGRDAAEARAESSLIGVGAKKRDQAFKVITQVIENKKALKVLKDQGETLEDSTKEALLALAS